MVFPLHIFITISHLDFKKEGYEVVVLSTTPHFNVVEEQLAKQPLKWKIPGIYKESDFHGIKGNACATKEVQEHCIAYSWFCLLAHHFVSPWFVHTQC